MQVHVNTEQVEPDLADMIVDKVYGNVEDPNIRDVIKIGRIARNRNDVLMIVGRLNDKKIEGSR